MKNNLYGYILRVFVSTVMLLVAAAAFSGCASASGKTPASKEAEPPLFEVRSPQNVVYNGKPQSIVYLYTGDEKIDVVYFTSPRDRADDRSGSTEDPADIGTYYVRLIRPGRGKTIPAKEVFATLNILKRPVKITAAKVQEAVYDGDPKRVHAAAEPPVPLSFSYYPNPELRETAKKATPETTPGQRTITQTFRGYRRVDAAPSEQGTYYVWIYYPGNNTNEPASLDVEFIISLPE